MTFFNIGRIKHFYLLT